MINPYYFFDENVNIDFKFKLESHKISQADSILSSILIYTAFEIETRYVIKIIQEMATIYARLINQYKFKTHKIIFSSLL